MLKKEQELSHSLNDPLIAADVFFFFWLKMRYREEEKAEDKEIEEI